MPVHRLIIREGRGATACGIEVEFASFTSSMPIPRYECIAAADGGKIDVEAYPAPFDCKRCRQVLERQPEVARALSRRTSTDAGAMR